MDSRHRPCYFKLGIPDRFSDFMNDEPGKTLSTGSNQIGSAMQEGGTTMQRPGCHLLRTLAGQSEGCVYILLASPCDTSNKDTTVVGKANFDMLLRINPLATDEKTMGLSEWEWTFGMLSIRRVRLHYSTPNKVAVANAITLIAVRRSSRARDSSTMCACVISPGP